MADSLTTGSSKDSPSKGDTTPAQACLKCGGETKFIKALPVRCSTCGGATAKNNVFHCDADNWDFEVRAPTQLPV